MKSPKLNKFKNAVRYVRIDPYTWIEKRINETDEEARQRFLAKLTRAIEIPRLQPGL